MMQTNNQPMNRREILKLGGGLLAFGGALTHDPGEALALTATQGQKIMKAALSKVGLRYQLGATDITKSCDCSSLAQWCYSQGGIAIPRTSAAQYSACRFCINAVGALLFFATDPQRPRTVTHVAISCGDGTMVDANSAAGKVVHERWQNNAYWQPLFITSASL